MSLYTLYMCLPNVREGTGPRQWQHFKLITIFNTCGAQRNDVALAQQFLQNESDNFAIVITIADASTWNVQMLTHQFKLSVILRVNCELHIGGLLKHPKQITPLLG